MKKIISVLLTIILTLGICSISVFATEVTANPTNSKITIDGVEVKFDAYNINGNNYFKLRDIAYSLNNTEKSFSVNWVAENNSANLIPGEKYVSVGGEMSLGDNAPKSATLSNTNIMVNGNKVTATAYMINNNNYFKLRDLGTILNFGVDWDEDTQTVIIKSTVNETVKINVDLNYIQKEKVSLPATQSNQIEIMGKNSSVHQFLYKDEGMAYAYIENNSEDLTIVLPNNKLVLEKLYPILGDVIADKDGNIYVVWGKISEIIDDKKQQSIFVSKYSPNGENILTKGVYDSYEKRMYYVSKEPFSGSNTVSAIQKDFLVISFGKIIYDGSQCGGVVAVKLSDLSPVYKPDWTKVYTEKCYGTDIAWHDNISDFFFISESTFDKRGFNLSSYRSSSVIFDFYLEDNAQGNADIVDKTFAQMGGLIYTDKGFVFCGASAKSISEDAKNENQNLFIQMFDVDWNGNVSYMGGDVREGMSSDNNQDSDFESSSLKHVTNYGVRWLTNYSNKSVVRPQIVRADDKFVIIWSIYEPNNKLSKKTAYMILSDDGEILVPETELNYGINSYEKPIYHNGVVSWIYYNNSDGQLYLVELNIE